MSWHECMHCSADHLEDSREAHEEIANLSLQVVDWQSAAGRYEEVADLLAGKLMHAEARIERLERALTIAQGLGPHGVTCVVFYDNMRCDCWKQSMDDELSAPTQKEG